MNSIIKFIMPLVLILGLSISCSSSDDSNPAPPPPPPGPATSSIKLTASQTSSTLIENVTYVFTVLDEKGTNVSESADFEVNDITIPTNQFTPDAVGEYKVIAKWNGLTSNSLSIVVTVDPVDNTNKFFAHKVLVEDFTGAGCGWCPRVSKAIELAEAASDKMIAVAIHNPVFGPDPFTFAGRAVLENKLGVRGYPTAYINRSTLWSPPENTNYQIPINAPHLKESSPIGIKIESNLTATSGTVDISLSFKESFQNLKYVVFIVEDGLKYKQTNYTNLYGGGGTLPNFIHNNTLRATFGNLLGTSIDNASSAKDSKVTINTSIPTFKSEDITKLKVVVAILDDKGVVLNVQRAAANHTLDFEYVN
ncbi:Omp28-related outer membrane protein [Flavobacterium sp. NKUCC04_CG]|uniref:Omp28-related outer membrane protein n=1 Tax=Flavobacterium sp. NKUCC04_CG TaxID=2842121 RepID=UPI001C5B0473|nr:Omp28-related outer membrane protein [Flavobacterium sp. NKUCC04_CG]MBW3519930.1 Omp28-related outer membrane protein [Flavobacterium sp. NKUCC04_CG]